MLPDGDTVLFTLDKRDQLPPNMKWGQAQIVLQSLKSGLRKVLLSGRDARYIPGSDVVVYASASPPPAASLLAAAFDVKSLRIGDPIAFENVGLSFNIGAAQYSFSRDGTMVYLPAPSASMVDRSVALIDLTGAVTRLDIPPGQYGDPHFALDGKQIAWSQSDEGMIWIFDLGGLSPTRRLNSERRIANSVWTRDGHIVLTSVVGSENGLSWQPADGSAAAEQLIKPGTFKNPIPMSVSSKANVLIFKDVKLGRDAGVDVYSLSLTGAATPKL